MTIRSTINSASSMHNHYTTGEQNTTRCWEGWTQQTISYILLYILSAFWIRVWNNTHARRIRYTYIIYTPCSQNLTFSRMWYQNLALTSTWCENLGLYLYPTKIEFMCSCQPRGSSSLREDAETQDQIMDGRSSGPAPNQNYSCTYCYR